MDPFQRNPVPTLTILIILAVAIVCLNALAIYVLLKGNRRKLPVEFPLLSLLFANGLLGLVAVPSYAIKKWNHDNDSHACDVFRFSYFVSAHVALFSLLGICIERIIALVFPLRYRKVVTHVRAISCIVCMWLFVIILDIIPFTSKEADDDEFCHYNPQKEWSVAMITLTNLIPFPILVANYAYIIKIAFYQTHKLSSTGSVNKSRSVKQNLQMVAQLRATKRIIVIIGAYIVCWGPSCAYYMLASLCPHSCFQVEKDNHNVKQWLRFILKLLVFIHALVAPVVFCWRNQIFRKQAKEVLKFSEFTQRSQRFVASLTLERTSSCTPKFEVKVSD